MVVIETAFGDIEVELFADKAPLTSAAFLGYIDSGWYDRSDFYRVLHIDNQPSNAPKSELIQGGIHRSEFESPAEAAERELLEETGYKGKLSPTVTIYPLPGSLDMRLSLFEREYK